MKNLLAIDTSTAVLRLALRFGEDRLVKVREAVPQSHGEVLMPRIGELTAAAGLTVRDLDSIAVSIGPGSFTGLRIGLAAAKGMVMALGIPLVPVTAFEVAAVRLESAGRVVNVIIPLNRDECIRCRISGRAEIGEPEIIRYHALAAAIGAEAIGAVGFNLSEKLPGLSNPDLSERLEYEATDLIDIGMEKLSAGAPLPSVADLEPLYLQKSQAEIRFEQRQ